MCRNCSLSPSVGTAFMAIFPNVYVSMVMISSMGIISMSISYCPYALLGQYHEMKQVQTQKREGRCYNFDYRQTLLKLNSLIALRYI